MRPQEVSVSTAPVDLGRFNQTVLETEWVVISGGPCSGKSSVIAELANRGFNTFPEAAREYIEDRIRLGESMSNIRSDQKVLQDGIMERILCTVAASDPSKLIFFDRGIPDCVAYLDLAKVDSQQEFSIASKFAYRKVFLMEGVPYSKDDVRTESNIEAQRISKAIENTYRMLGYEIVHVPQMSIEERVEFILSNINSSDSLI